MNPLSVLPSGMRKRPSALFLAALVAGLVVSPFAEGLRDGDLLDAIQFSVVLVCGLGAVGGSRKDLCLGGLLAAPALAGKWTNHWAPGLLPDWLFVVPALFFLLLLETRILGFILKARRVNSEVLSAGVAGYLLLGLGWALAYVLSARPGEHSFAFTWAPASGQMMKGFKSIYFSFVTLSTVGYGDIVPSSGATRMLAMTEATTGTFYIAILISRLVSLRTAAGITEEPRSLGGGVR